MVMMLTCIIMKRVNPIRRFVNVGTKLNRKLSGNHVIFRQECVKRETIKLVPREPEVRRMSSADNPTSWSKQYRNGKTWAHIVIDGESPQYNQYDTLFPKLPQCGICFDNILNTELLKTICGHDYHLKCIGKWFDTTLKRTCPICRLVL